MLNKIRQWWRDLIYFRRNAQAVRNIYFTVVARRHTCMWMLDNNPGAYDALQLRHNIENYESMLEYLDEELAYVQHPKPALTTPPEEHDSI